MTLNELKTEVSALGFEPGTDTNPILITAANRALSMICAEIPTVKTLHAPAVPCSPSYYLAALHHARGEHIELMLSGRAYTFWASGKGSFAEISDSGSRSREFDSKLSNFRGFINGKTTLVFDGEGDYDVLGLSVFDRVRSDELEDIPTAPENRIKPDELVDDFFAFAEPPRDASGEFIAGSRLEGRCVILPLDYSGVVTLNYESRPKMITESSTEIDISPSAEHLLPILTAYFVWLDDEAELAESYLRLYRSLLDTAKRKSKTDSAEYNDILRWA